MAGALGVWRGWHTRGLAASLTTHPHIKNARLPASLPDLDLALPLKGAFPCTRKPDRWPVRLGDAPSCHSSRFLSRASGTSLEGRGDWDRSTISEELRCKEGTAGVHVGTMEEPRSRVEYQIHQTRLWLPPFPIPTACRWEVSSVHLLRTCLL